IKPEIIEEVVKSKFSFTGSSNSKTPTFGLEKGNS
ncbi:MAG: hypothetical protein RLZZ414_32, partial [Bacteroidota bacterium]